MRGEKQYMGRYLNNFNRFRPLLYELVARDIKIKYRKSVLGVLWSLLNPLLMMCILSVVFSNLFRFDIENYALYVLSGQIIFNFYNEATTSSMTAIIGNSALIKKVYIPKYMFVISRVLSSVINVMASFCALIIVMLVQHMELHYTVFLAVLPLLYVTLFSLGVGLLLAAIAVKFRDVMHLYTVFTTALLYLTPVIYSLDLLEGKKVGWIVKLNPLTGILEMFRNSLLYHTVPSVGQVGFSTVAVVLMLSIGMLVFYRQQDQFILNI